MCVRLDTCIFVSSFKLLFLEYTWWEYPQWQVGEYSYCGLYTVLLGTDVLYEFPVAQLENHIRGGSRVFKYMQRGRNKLCARIAHLELEARSPQGPLKGPGSFRIIGAPSCYLGLILKLSDTKLDLKHPSRLKFRGGSAPVAHPPGLATAQSCCQPRESFARTIIIIILFQ